MSQTEQQDMSMDQQAASLTDQVAKLVEAAPLPLSALGAALLITRAQEIAKDSRDFARKFGVAHALVIRECGMLADELGVLAIEDKHDRTQRVFYDLTERGQQWLAGDFGDIISEPLQTGHRQILGRQIVDRDNPENPANHPEEELHPATQSVASRRVFKSSASRAVERHLANEVAVSMVFDGSSYAVMMATPANLRDFAFGFALSEGFIASRADVDRFELVEHEDGIEARFWLINDRSQALRERKRMMMGPIGCGLCGVESLDQANRDVPTIRENAISITARQIYAALEELSLYQPLHGMTNSLHAAAFVVPQTLPQGGIRNACEDVGRHNALDKLIGSFERCQIDPAKGSILMTSRLSVELVQKAAMVGCPLLMAVSAPTASAVRIAQECGITLIGRVRADSFEIFTHPHRVREDSGS